MSEISIVTAFFNIGRESWRLRPELIPHGYLHRSTAQYLKSYEYLERLDNEIIVVTTEDIVEKIEKQRGRRREKTKYIITDPFKTFSQTRAQIARIQQDEKYRAMIVPSEIHNPEYWNPDYVLINLLKSHFVNLAINQQLVTHDMVAWIDFAYCRKEQTVPPCGRWSYNFNPNKIHLFSLHDYKPRRPIADVIATNDVPIFGAKIIAHKKLWPKLEELMWKNFDKLQSQNLVDDDQTYLLMSYLMKPKLFELHRIPDFKLGLNPFVLFYTFNDFVIETSFFRHPRASV